MIVRNKLNKSPHPKLSIRNPFTQLLASNTIIVLITNRNKPNVTRVSGRVKRISIGLRKTFNSASTIANQIAVPYPSTCTPGSTLASMKATAAETSNRIIKFMIVRQITGRVGCMCMPGPVNSKIKLNAASEIFMQMFTFLHP
jgi:hypothetical protein